MDKFPRDARLEKVIGAFQRLGFQEIRRTNHIVMARNNPDGSKTPLVMPNHRIIKGPTLRMILGQVEITREEFLTAFEQE